MKIPLRVIVDIAPGRDPEPQIAVALRIALEQGGTLTGVCSAWPTISLSDAIAHNPVHARAQEQELRQTNAVLRSRFERLTEQAAVPAAWWDGIADPRVALVEQALLADLVVMRLAGHDAFAQADPIDVAAASGAPVLRLGSRLEQSFKGALIGWKDCREAACAVRAALPLLRQAETVTVVGVGEDVAEDCLEAVQRYLAEHGVAAQHHHIPASGKSEAAVLAELAHREELDFLVAGARAQGRWKERMFGGATEDLLKTDISWLLAN